MHRLLFALAGLAWLASAPTLSAQGRAGSVELGFDAGVEFSNVEDLNVDEGPDMESGDEIHVGIPLQRFRVGYHASDKISLEPFIGLDYQKVEDPTDDADDGDFSATNLNLGTSILIHFLSDPDNPVAYGLLRGTYNVLDVNEGSTGDDDDGSQSQFGAAAGLGIKLPAADRLDVRLEGAFERRFENKDDLLPSSNNYQINLGFSWYTGSR